MANEPPAYTSYLLRLWRTSDSERPRGGEERAVWRASLESPLTHKTEGFRSLDELFDFLRRRTEIVAGTEIDGSETDGCAESEP